MENPNEKIIYSLNVENLQAVAKVIYGKELSSEQIDIVGEEVSSGFTNWFDIVESAIDNTLDLEKLEEPNWDDYPY
ncbi:MAG TPA: hypothetical protein VNI84_08800 [Pyrinomonadaceae bacterium]|nr:hypothetical protein [Pyrinomonadaceae bacterium]